MRQTTISSSCLDTRVIFSKDVNSGRRSVGQKQMARFLLSMLFSDECSDTLLKTEKTRNSDIITPIDVAVPRRYYVVCCLDFAGHTLLLLVKILSPNLH